MAFWFGNHDPRTPPAASTCQVMLTVPNPITNSNVMSAFTGTQVPLSSYQTSGTDYNWTITGLPITALIVVAVII
jgi:hypothetical protein